MTKPRTRPYLFRSAACGGVFAVATMLMATAPAGAQVDWTRARPTQSPPGHGITVWDEALHRVLLVQSNSSTNTMESWGWDGRNWSPLPATLAPPARQGGQAMAYDRSRGVVVLFGGFGYGIGYLNDTWTFDGTTWTAAAVTGPSPRIAAVMCQDEARQQVVLFGGRAAVGTNAIYANDTWVWNGVAWSQRVTAHAPSGRALPGMAYDSRRQRIVLFGGNPTGTTVADDTWEWDGVDWQQRWPAVSPPARAGAAMVYDPGRDRVVLYGGDNGVNAAVPRDTWEWDGSNWLRRPTVATPTANTSAAVAYDATAEHVVLFGGWNLMGAPPWKQLNETWTYAAVRRGSIAALGTGCAGSAGPPTLAAGSGLRPYVGDTFDLELGNLPSGPGLVVMVLGLQTQPVSLAGLGMPGCLLYTTVASSLVSTTTGTRWLTTLAVPANPSVVGADVAAQGLVLDPPANAIGVVASNVVVLMIGSK